MTPVDFIRLNLPLTDVPDLPGLRLHLAHSKSGLGKLSHNPPYWAYVWAGGHALARHILDNVDLVQKRRVLDLGAGSGLVGIFAARAGATVMAAEIDPLGQVAIALNARANAVSIDLLEGDILPGPAPAVDLILVGDLFYDTALVTPVLAFLDRALAQGIEVLIGDPGRTALPLARLAPVSVYDVPDFRTTGQCSGHSIQIDASDHAAWR